MYSLASIFPRMLLADSQILLASCCLFTSYPIFITYTYYSTMSPNETKHAVRIYIYVIWTTRIRYKTDFKLRKLLVLTVLLGIWSLLLDHPYLSCVPSILLSVAVLPEKVSCPIPAACSGVGTLLATSGHFVPKSDSLRCFPSRGIPFRTVILFSRCRPSMNYPKSTRKKCNSRNIARIAF